MLLYKVNLGKNIFYEYMNKWLKLGKPRIPSSRSGHSAFSLSVNIIPFILNFTVRAFWVRGKKYILFSIIWLLIFSPLLVKAENIDILNIQAENIDGKNVLIKWVTDKASRGKVIYGRKTDELTAYIGVSGAPSIYHEAFLANLKPETKYYYQIVVDDAGGPTVYSFVKKFKTIKYSDKVPPQVSNARLYHTAGTAAVIAWDTDEPSTSRVEYDSAGTYKTKSGSNDKVTNHLVIIKNLKPTTQYFLRLYSVDKDNNKSGYSYKDFTTHSDSVDKEDLKVSYLRPSGPADSFIYSKSMVISFKTNHYAKGSVSVSGKGFKTQVKNFDYGLNQLIIFSALLPETNYNAVVSMVDIFGKKAEEKFSFKTRKVTAAPEVIVAPESEVMVLGAEFAYYTSASALYKVAGSAAIYSIINNQRHLIISPSSFREYGYNFGDVKTVRRETLLSYPLAKLVKSPGSRAVYYLYERPQGNLWKINIPSPSVFSSYSKNSWANLVTISQKEIDSYENVRLIKIKDSPAVYYLENNIKRFVSEAVFKKRGFKESEVFEVNQTHLESYQAGTALE